MDEKKTNAIPGELGFTIVLLGLCIYLLSGSLKLFGDDPQLSGAGGLPLILSVVLLAVTGWILFQTVRQKAESKQEGLLAVLKGVFPRDIVVFIALLIVYCIGLNLHLGFYPCTGVFLIAAMEYLDPRGWKWNLITTVVLLAIIYLSFTMVFKVNLP